jgi:hypothetical protein
MFPFTSGLIVFLLKVLQSEALGPSRSLELCEDVPTLAVPHSYSNYIHLYHCHPHQCE